MSKEQTVRLSRRVTELLQMHTYRRPSGGKTESLFIQRFIQPLGAMPDDYGNYWLMIGGAPILWSCHTDTVHRQEGAQRIAFGDDIVTLAQHSGSNCLGADCTVGVWIMANMIRAGIPGTYVFHADEEIGGLGSDYVARKAADRLDGLQFAIAFDRKGHNEIITHQAGSRCCSDAFAESLAMALYPLPYLASDKGTFTDTANYSHIIPECTNIAVGYHGQHTAKETLDVRHACDLLDRIMAAPWDRLICSRDPHEPDYWDSGNDDLAGYVWENPDLVADFLDASGYSLDDVRDYQLGAYARRP